MIRKLYNDLANANNTLKVLDTESGCCPDSGLVGCEYSLKDLDITTVTGLTYLDPADGTTEVALAFSATVTDMADFKAKLNVAIKSIGFIHDEEQSVKFQANGSNFDIQIISELALHNLTTTGADADFTEKCVRVPECSYKFQYAGGTSKTLVRTISGADTSFALNTAVYGTGGVTAALEADLASNFGDNFWKIVENDTLQVWEIWMVGNPDTTTFTFDGTQLDRCECYQDWAAS